METVKQLARLRAAGDAPPQAETPLGEETVTATGTALPAREAAQAAAQEQRALDAARQHTQARVDAVLAALAPAPRQALEERAKALVPLRETDFGYYVTLRFTREDLILQEQLGFDRWPQLVAQVRARGAADGDAVLEACRLEAILDDELVVSVPTAQDKARFTEYYLGVLEELASTPPPRTRIQVLLR